MTDGVYLAADVIRGEPDYVEQVPRLASYSHDRPEAQFIYLGRWWQYFHAYDGGFVAIGGRSLKELLDKLDALGLAP